MSTCFDIGFVINREQDLKWLAVAGRSLLDNCSQPSRVRFHILWSELRPEMLRELEESWSDLSCGCVFYFLPDYLGEKTNVPEYGYWFWTWMGHILPPDVEFVLNLDCDVMVRGDIAALWSLDLKGKIAAVVWDPCARVYDYRGELAALGREVGLEFQECSIYFNTGVLFVDLVQWRAQKIPERLDELFVAHRQEVRFHDQNELNLLLQGQVYPLSPAWNLLEPLEFYEKWDFEVYRTVDQPQRYFQAHIQHFAGPHKPTSQLVRSALKREFYHYLDRTVYAGWRSRNDRSLLGQIFAELLELHYIVVRGFKQGVLPRAGKQLRAVIYRAPYVVLLYPAIPIYRWFRKLRASIDQGQPS